MGKRAEKGEKIQGGERKLALCGDKGAKGVVKDVKRRAGQGEAKEQGPEERSKRLEDKGGAG